MFPARIGFCRSWNVHESLLGRRRRRRRWPHETPFGFPGRIYRVGFSGGNGHLSCFTFVPQDLQQLIFYAVAATRAPEAARLRVAEFITRANYGLRIGNFELDFGDGEVRYKTSIDYSGTTLLPCLIRNVAYTRYAPWISTCRG
jgi:hypothetical protein